MLVCEAAGGWRASLRYRFWLISTAVFLALPAWPVRFAVCRNRNAAGAGRLHTSG